MALKDLPTSRTTGHLGYLTAGFTHAVPWMFHEACCPSGQILTTSIDYNGIRILQTGADEGLVAAQVNDT